jgi:hypothetical protein
MLAKAAMDPNPDMKLIAAGFGGRLCIALGKKVGSFMKGLVESLIANLNH